MVLKQVPVQCSIGMAGGKLDLKLPAVERRADVTRQAVTSAFSRNFAVQRQHDCQPFRSSRRKLSEWTCGVIRQSCYTSIDVL